MEQTRTPERRWAMDPAGVAGALRAMGALIDDPDSPEAWERAREALNAAPPPPADTDALADFARAYLAMEEEIAALTPLDSAACLAEFASMARAALAAGKGK